MVVVVVAVVYRSSVISRYIRLTINVLQHPYKPQFSGVLESLFWLSSILKRSGYIQSITNEGVIVVLRKDWFTT